MTSPPVEVTDTASCTQTEDPRILPAGITEEVTLEVNIAGCVRAATQGVGEKNTAFGDSMEWGEVWGVQSVTSDLAWLEGGHGGGCWSRGPSHRAYPPAVRRRRNAT